MIPIAAGRDFSMLRARKRELLDEQRSRWAEGQPLQPEELLGRWPTDPDSDPDAASLLLEDYLQRRRRGGEVSLAEYERRFPEQERALEGLLAQETVFRSMGGESDGAGFSPPLARSGRRGLRLPPVPAPRARGVRPGVPGGAGRPGRPPRRAQGHGHRRGRAPDARPVAAHQHRPDLFAPRGSARGLACGLHALPGRGEPLRPSWRSSGPIRRDRSPASNWCAPWKRSRPRGLDLPRNDETVAAAATPEDPPQPGESARDEDA